MFAKYNGVLRAFTGADFLVRERDRLCGTNRYTTTIHIINSCVIKLGKIMKAVTVYRGLKGGRLPQQFMQKDPDTNVAGGVEYAFMSTTRRREVAMSYAAGGVGTVLDPCQTVCTVVDLASRRVARPRYGS